MTSAVQVKAGEAAGQASGSNPPAVAPGGGVTAGATEVVALAATYRLAVLNELQVLLGWAQLGNTERVVSFIYALRDAYHAENELCRWADPETAALLLLRRAVADVCRTEVRFALEAPGPFRIPAAARGTVADLVDACLAWMAAGGVGAPLLVSAASDQWCGSLTCLLPPGGDPSLAQLSEALASLRGEGAGLEADLALFQERGGEFGRIRRGGRESRCGFLLRWPHPPDECL